MKVLDIGCGTGEISFLASDLVCKNRVGEKGQVIGVDIDEKALSVAKQTAYEKGLDNVQFIKQDIANLSFEINHFDAIIGRRILMYQADALAIINHAKSFLKTGGIMLFQESDAMVMQLHQPDFPKHQYWQSLIWQTVRHEGGNLSIGSQLAHLMSQAGLQVQNYLSENVVQTPQTGSDIAWVVNMMLPRMTQFGLLNEDVNIEVLTQELTDEMQHATHSFVRDVNFGICAVKPQIILT